MGQVALTINGRSYQIACEDGQEDHLAELGAYIDKRVRELAGTVGQVGEMRLLVMASLLIADELSDLYDEVEALRAQARERARDSREPAAAPAPEPSAPARDEEALAAGLEAMAEKIELIATRLERA